MDQATDKLWKTSTEHVLAFPRWCKGCWRCIDACPKRVIGKAGILWRKHVVFVNPQNCCGCGKCVRICPQGVFSQRFSGGRESA